MVGHRQNSIAKAVAHVGNLVERLGDHDLHIAKQAGSFMDLIFDFLGVR